MCAKCRFAVWGATVSFVFLLIALLPGSTLSFAATIHVPGDQPTIQAGIDVTVDGDTVLVAPGMYAEHIDYLGKAIVVVSADGPETTTITKLIDGISLVFFQNGEDTMSVLEGFSLTESQGANAGGAVYNISSSPYIKGNVFRNNQADWGGALFSGVGSPIIRGNTFIENEGTLGGGAISCNGSSPIIVENIFDNNQAGHGGGVEILGGSSIIMKNIFTENSGNYGSAVSLRSSSNTALLKENIFVNNLSTLSGAIFAQGPYTIANNTVVFNDGYGIYLSGDAGMAVKNNIFAYNGNYGVYRIDSNSPILRHNDVFGNANGDYFGILPGSGSISENPLFCDTALADYYLASNSPCIGAGENGVDIGAFGVGCTTPAPEQPEVLAIGVDSPGDSLHITDHTPLLSWDYYDQQARPHTKSEIEVGTDDDWAVPEMWQPPTIEGSDESIEYAGDPLTDGTTYYTRTRVRNDTLWSPWLTAPFRMNSLPSPPLSVSPVSESVVLTGRPDLVVTNAVDQEGDELRYDFEVYRDEGLVDLAVYISGVIEALAMTSWTADSLTAENSRHFWRARASDGYENGPWSDVDSFIVDAYNEPPDPVDLILPEHEALVTDLLPSLSWSVTSDPDPDATAVYKIILGLDPGFVFKAELPGLGVTTIEWPDSLEIDITYYWKVEADDNRGGTSVSQVRSFTTKPECDCPDFCDLDGTAGLTPVDVVYIVNYAYKSLDGRPVLPLCSQDNGDWNCDGSVNPVDVVYYVNFVYKSTGDGPCDPCYH